MNVFFVVQFWGNYKALPNIFHYWITHYSVKITTKWVFLVHYLNKFYMFRKIIYDNVNHNKSEIYTFGFPSLSDWSIFKTTEPTLSNMVKKICTNTFWINKKNVHTDMLKLIILLLHCVLRCKVLKRLNRSK